jgi:putative hydrolase of the HAD superfamily
VVFVESKEIAVKKNELKAILFDMGSTLIEFENSTWEVLGKLCAQRGYGFLKEKRVHLPEFPEFSRALDEEFLKARAEVQDNLKEFQVEQVARGLCGALNITTSDGLCRGFLETYYHPITEQLTLIDGALKILREFREMNLKIGLVSNTIFPKEYHLGELKRFSLLQYLNAYHFSSEIGVRKPHPTMFLRTLSDLGVNASEAVFVGDRLVEDVRGAQKVGMKAILARHEGRDYSAPVESDAEIHRLDQLPHVVLSLFHN